MAAVASIQAVKPTANASTADTGAMDVDEDAVVRGPIDESHGGVKRKAGEDTEPAVKKLRTGMLVTSFGASAAELATTSRTCHCSSEEVCFADLPLIIRLLTGDHRDRENCTVFVSELPESATEGDLKALFKDVRSFPACLETELFINALVRRHSRGQDNKT